MSAASNQTGDELVVAADGSIPAEQLARIGATPGVHLRVVQAQPVETTAASASLSSLPDLAWEDFQRGSELASRDLTAT
jgi:hypothetical protein